MRINKERDGESGTRGLFPTIVANSKSKPSREQLIIFNIIHRHTRLRSRLSTL